MFAAKNPNLKVSGWQQYIQTDETALGQNVVPAAQAGHVWIWNTSTGGIPQAKVLAESGYPVVLDYADETYFDLAYTPAITEPGFTWAINFSDTQAALMSAVSATQTVSQINPAYQQNILGLEGTLWAENLATYDHMIYMALPKMAGLAEAGWSPVTITDINNQANWQSLANRLGCGQSGFLAYLNKLFAVHYRGYPNGIALEVPSSSCPKN
jgi:hexosaminidase